jgi:hypothetical protein
METAEEKVIGAAPAPNAGFLEDPNWMEPHPERAPFDRTWVSPTLDWSSYKKVWIAPVDVTHVLEMDLWDKVNVRTFKVKDDIAEMAVEFREDVDKAFRSDSTAHFQVIEDPNAADRDTVLLEIALVELVPSKAGLGILGTAAWVAPPEIGVPVATVAAFTQRGSVAFELRARDGATREVIAMAADRETGPMRVLDLRSATWYGNVHQALEIWAQQMVALANTPRDQQVKHSAYFTLMPW